MWKRKDRVLAAPASEISEDAKALIEAGLVDLGFCRASAGRPFREIEVAAEHFRGGPAQRLLSTHPLLDPAYLPDAVREAWKRGRFAEVVEYLASPVGLSAPWSSLFDPTRLLSGGEWATVAAFLRGLDDTTVLPTEARIPRHLTWAEAKTAVTDRARRTRRARALLGPRTTSTWDDAAEQAWVRATAAHSLPAAEGPLVSIVMPVWNRAARVAEAIESIQAQDLTAWELLVVDDGSTDDSVAVIQAISERDPRVRVIPRPHAGVCAARNAGLAEATGSYIAFLDSDNAWRSDYLGLMVRGMATSGAQAAYSGVRLRRGEEIVYRAYEGGLDHLLQLNHIDLNVFMVSAEIARRVGGFDVELRRWVDHDYAIRVAREVEPRLMPFIGCEYDDAREGEDRITTTESDHWQWAVLAKAWVDWERIERELPERVPGRTSVLMPTYDDSAMTTTAVAAVLATTADEDVEVVVVDNGSRHAVSIALEAAFVGVDRVRLVRQERNLNFAIGSNIGVAHSTGSLLLFLNNDTVARPGWLAPLRKRLEETDVLGVQPLLLYPDDTIQATGTVFPVRDGLPIHIAAGMPREDAEAANGLEWSAVTAAATLWRAETVVALRGFDPIYVNGMEDVDLCLRATELVGGHFAVETSSVIEHHESRTPGRGRNISANRGLFLARWRGRLPAPQTAHYEAFGLEIVQVGLDRQRYAAPRPIAVRRPRPPVSIEGRETPVLRWGVKAPAPAGVIGDRDPGTLTAERVADSLRACGQEAVVTRREAHAGVASNLDDVALAIRVDERVDPQPGRINVLWQRPAATALERDETDGFDLVIAASDDLDSVERVRELVAEVLRCRSEERVA